MLLISPWLLPLILHCASAFGPPIEQRSPLVVVGSYVEALAAAMSFCARDQLRSSNPSGDQQRLKSPIPPAQPIALFNQPPLEQKLSSDTISSLKNAIMFLGPSSLDNYEQVLANALQLLSRISDEDPMLHTSINFGCDDGAKTMQSLYSTRDRFSFMGLNLNTHTSQPDDGRFILSRESADEWGNKLATLLDGSQSSAAITMDIRTHLALLQANSIPRSRGVLGEEKDVWAIKGTIDGGVHVDNGDGMLMEYKFDNENLFGGCDPLLCPSTGSIIPSPISSGYIGTHQTVNNDAYAAAYSAVVGSGMDPLHGICVATSVKAVFQELGSTDESGTFCPPAYTWSTIDGIVEYSLRALGSVQQEVGLPRKMYKEFGYR